MVSSVDGLAGAAAVGSSGATAASRSCVGGGNRGLGASRPSTLRRTSRQAAAGHRARLTYARHLLPAPKSRSKATIRVRGCLRDDVGSTTAALPIAADSLQRPIWQRSGQNCALKRLIAVRLADASQSARTTRQNLHAEVLASLEHDPEKWIPVFGKDHAPTINPERDDVSKKSHHALGAVDGQGFTPDSTCDSRLQIRRRQS